MNTNASKNRLVTGDKGFVGNLCMQTWPNAVGLSELAGAEIDICNKATLKHALSQISVHNPLTEVLHLAGISFVPDAVANPRGTYEVNFLGTLNLLECLQELGFKGRFIYVSSGDAYGLVATEHLPVHEDMPLMPRNPYAVSKAAAEALCYQWSQSSGFEVLVARPFNHIGPGQSERFALSDFAKQIAGMRHSVSEKKLSVGNIEVTRDFLDVRDVVRAYDMLFKGGSNANVYNICSSREYLLSDLVRRLIHISGVDIAIEVDASRWRPAEQTRMVGSHTRLTQATGWAPVVSLDETLLQIYQYWEHRLEK
jgi:GDP-4-dehydro-6-deoxy-D-mannose reductase